MVAGANGSEEVPQAFGPENPVCPLMSQVSGMPIQSGIVAGGQKTVNVQVIPLMVPCVKEACALWHPSPVGQCSIKRIAWDMFAVGKLADKWGFGHGTFAG